MPLFHSTGAGISIAAAGTTVLLAASTMVAFNGWPGMREDLSAAPVRMADVPPPLREAGSDAPRSAGASRAIRLRPVPAGTGRDRIALAARRSVSPARQQVLGISESAPRKRRTRASGAPSLAADAPRDVRADATPAVTDAVARTVEEARRPAKRLLNPVRTVVGGTVDQVDRIVGGAGEGLTAPRR